MEIDLSKHFYKRFQKLSPKLKEKTRAALKAFTANPFERTLNNHPLTAKWTGYRSINITGDYRAIYLPVSEHLAKFYTVDTHSNLYG